MSATRGETTMTTKTDGQLKRYKKYHAMYGCGDFAKRFSHPFLVVEKDQGPVQENHHGYETVCVPPDQLARILQESLLRAASSSVIRLVKKGTDVFSGMVNVGRTANCDVVLDSPLVSKFHAYFAKDPKAGAYCLIDASSTNGTYINDGKMKPKERKVLSDGDRISFGRQVTFSYYTPEGFYDLLAQIPD